MGSACGCGSSLKKAPKKVVTTETTITKEGTPVDASNTKPAANNADPSSPNKNNPTDATGGGANENHENGQTNGASNTGGASGQVNPNDPDYVAEVHTKPVAVPEAQKGVPRVDTHFDNMGYQVNLNAPEPVKKPVVKLEGPFADGSPLNKTISLFAISRALFNLLVFVTDDKVPWEGEQFAETFYLLFNDLKKECVVMCNHQDLRNWVFHLHARKTGAALGSGKKISNALNHLTETINDFRARKCENLALEEIATCNTNLKELCSLFLHFLNSCELVVSADFAFEVNELAKTLRDVVDTATGKLNFVFDDIARICTTNALRICRLGMWKSIQVFNTAWTKQIVDMSITVTRATKMMHAVGTKLTQDNNDQFSFQQLTALTRGVVAQIKNVQMLTATEPMMTPFMPYIDQQLVQEFIALYDVGIRDVQEALTMNYSQVVLLKGDKITRATNSLINEVNALKAHLTSQDKTALVQSITNISETVEVLCANVYKDLSVIGDSNAILREQLMETMQCSLHNVVHIQFVGCSRALMHLTVNPEITLLTAVRLLLICVSIMIEACAYMKKHEIIEKLDSNLDIDDDDTPMLPADIKAAIVYILHFGRPTLYRGEGEEIPEPEPVLPVIINNITYPDGAPKPRKPQQVSASETDETDASTEESTSEETSADSSSTASEKVVANKPTTKSTAKEPEKKPDKPAEEVKPKEPEKPKAPEQKIWANPLEIPAEIVLTMNPADYTVDNLPYGFEQPPCPKPGPRRPDFTQEEYKAYMRTKYEYETWENKLILWNVKLKRRIDECKPK